MAGEMNDREGGFSLLEVLLANLVCLFLFLAWAQLVLSFQTGCLNQIEAHQVQAAARVARHALGTSVHQAGQNRKSDYLVSPNSSELGVFSDFSGNSGDPDKTLNHPFENQHFRMNPEFLNPITAAEFDRTADLQWKSGSGSYQAFISRTVKAMFRINNHREGPKSVTAELKMRARHFAGKRTNYASRSFQFTLPVEKNREQWFRYDSID
ncbi:MAG TPA: hypothetical protein VGQ81_13580 [Acidobacteriota bacterium]|jgi:hypothetical protein|nr:hypothetical protein [Acidobacteriota bacterium]